MQIMYRRTVNGTAIGLLVKKEEVRVCLLWCNHYASDKTLSFTLFLLTLFFL